MDTVSFASRRTIRSARERASNAPVDFELSQADLDALVGIWKGVLADVLDGAQTSVDDHFFELGGTSLDALLMSARIKKALGVQISLTAFFDEPTLGALYEDVRAGLAGRAAAPLAQASGR